MPASRRIPAYVNALVRQAENLDLADRREDAITRLRNIVCGIPTTSKRFALGDILRYDEQWGEASDVYSQLIAQIEGDRRRVALFLRPGHS